MAFNQNGSDDSGGEEESGGNRPVLTNNDEGAAAWLEKDKNENAYISVSLPLGLSVNLFPNSDADREAFNLLADHLDEGGR